MTLLSKEYLLLFNAVTAREGSRTPPRGSVLAGQRQADGLFLETPPAVGPAVQAGGAL